MAQIASVGMIPFGKAHSVAWVAWDAAVLHRRAKHLPKDAERILYGRRAKAVGSHRSHPRPDGSGPYVSHECVAPLSLYMAVLRATA
jgi:hypothetical protein